MGSLVFGNNIPYIFIDADT